MTDIVPQGEVRLWIPGLGETDRKVRAVANAVRDYDESLRLARHEVYGDWVIVIGDEGHPVYGFGKELPQPQDVESILSKYDMKRHGRKIMDDLARITKQRALNDRYLLQEMDGELAEKFEHAFVQEDRHPTKTRRPKGKEGLWT